MELTTDQTKAAETTDRNVVVSAGAGTGKTAVLVARFINLVRSGLADVNQILTITFTEKAAEEMKQRIADGFRGLGMRKQKTAVETSYISTIHSFCSRLIKENPFLAGVDPQFEVMDDMDRQLMLSELFDELFSEGEDDFLELAEHYAENAVSRAIIAYMDLCRSMGREVEYVEKLIAQPEVLTRKAEALADKRAARAMREIEKRLTTLSSLKASGSYEERRREILTLGDSLSDVGSFRGAAEAMASMTARMPAVPKKGNSRAVCLEVREQLSRIGRVFKEARAEIFFDRDTEEMVLPCKVALLKGTALFWRKYEERKRERGVLDYEDLQLIVRRLLRDNRSLRRDYSGRFRYVLVDEFQDINWLQKELIELLTSGKSLFVVGDSCQSIYGFRNADVEIFVDLVEKSRSSPTEHCYLYLDQNFRSGQNLIHFFNFFFSGLWQGADAGFHPLHHARKEAEEPTAASVEIMLFEQRQDEGRAVENPDEVRQREAKAVAARIIRAAREGEITVYDPAIASARPLRYGDVAVLCRTRASYSAYAEAFSQLGVPFCMVGGQSFYEKQEIADLINLLTIIDNPFRDIPLVAVLRSPFVRVSDDTLFLLATASRSGSAASTLRSSDRAGHSYGESGTEAAATRPPEHHSGGRASISGACPAAWAFEAIRKADSIPDVPDGEKRKLLHFADLLEGLRRRKDSMPLHKLVKAALDSTPYLTRAVASPGGSQRAANVSKFLDLLREYEARQTNGIGGFLRFYEVMRYHGPREEEAALESFSGDVVKLMTIHAAKGLEFPVVIVADMSRRFNFDTDRFLISREMEIGCNPYQESAPASSGRKLVFDERKERQLAEEKRLLYVAATRARDHLVLAGSYRAERECEIDRATYPMDWLMAMIGKETPLPKPGDSCEVALGEARVRILVDVVCDETARPEAARSLLERHFDRIAAGETIPVADDSRQRFLPEVRKVLQRIASREAARPDTTPAEISVSQLMLFEECPYKFFLREMLKFPDREVMEGLGMCPAGESNVDRDRLEAESEPPMGLTKRRFGELVHQCLEQVDLRAGEKQDLHAVTARFFASPEEARAAQELIRRFLRSADGTRLQNAREVHREVPVKAAVENVIISGVIDVYYLDEENRWTILDFKTGAEPTEHTSEYTGYDFQMLLYAFLIAEATEVRPEKAVIHFLRPGSSRLLTTSAEELERVRKRIVEIVTAIGRGEFGKAGGDRCRQCEYVAVCAPRDDGSSV